MLDVLLVCAWIGRSDVNIGRIIFFSQILVYNTNPVLLVTDVNGQI